MLLCAPLALIQDSEYTWEISTDSEEEKCQYSIIILFLKHEYARIYLQAHKSTSQSHTPCPVPWAWIQSEQ